MIKEKSDGGFTYSDPTMVQVGFSRQTYGGKGVTLFGSSVKNSSVISLTISQSEVNRHLSQDWYHAKPRPIIEVLLTPLQFSELLTTMNVGFGVPGTLVKHGDQNFEVPEYPSKAEQFKEEVSVDLKEVIEQINEAGQIIEGLLDDTKPIGKSVRKQLKDLVDSYRRLIEGHFPFVINQFSKQMAKTVAEAKAEVDAFVEDTVVKTGIEALKNQRLKIAEESL
jgi:hypothetical protein